MPTQMLSWMKPDGVYHLAAASDHVRGVTIR
jgi:hypothetical protein